MGKSKVLFEKISGVRKIIRCSSCGKRIEIKNFNRTKCDKCGYRGEGQIAAVNA